MAELSVLLVEDKPSDVRLVIEAFKQTKIQNNLSVVSTGEEALKFLRKTGKYKDAPRPDIILLDLKLPGKSGHDVLKSIKEDEKLMTIPVIMLTHSDSPADIKKSYKYNANCYITKPFKMKDFIELVKYIEKFWFNYVKLPGE
ncbi:MAG: response regulator [Candidatus Goldiibacteriota bacterium]